MHNQALSNKDIFIKQLSKEEILSVYIADSIRHFPENERKPVSSIERMTDEGIYIGYGLFFHCRPDKLISYAFFTALPEEKISLLDYFAVMEDYRSLGIGSLFLQQMKLSAAGYDGFLIESEDPGYAKDEQELTIRNKRISFYTKNGAVPTGLTAKVFGVPYRLLYFPLPSKETPSTASLHACFGSIYRRMVSPQNYETQVHIFPHNLLD